MPDLEQIGFYAEVARNIALAVVAVAGILFSPKLWGALKTGVKNTRQFFVSVTSLPDTLSATNDRISSLESALAERGTTHESLNFQLQQMAERIKRIDHQVHPNGGKSLSDMVNSIVRELGEVRSSQHTTNNVLRVCWDALGTFGVFYCTPAGDNTYCSAVYLKWLGAIESEMMGYGWVNFIHHEDRHAVVREWESCAEDERYFSMTYRMVRDGQPFEVEAYAQPLRDQSGQVVQWVGMVRRLRPEMTAVERRQI